MLARWVAGAQARAARARCLPTKHKAARLNLLVSSSPPQAWIESLEQSDAHINKLGTARHAFVVVSRHNNYHHDHPLTAACCAVHCGLQLRNKKTWPDVCRSLSSLYSGTANTARHTSTTLPRLSKSTRTWRCVPRRRQCGQQRLLGLLLLQLPLWRRFVMFMGASPAAPQPASCA